MVLGGVATAKWRRQRGRITTELLRTDGVYRNRIARTRSKNCGWNQASRKTKDIWDFTKAPKARKCMVTTDRKSPLFVRWIAAHRRASIGKTFVATGTSKAKVGVIELNERYSVHTYAQLALLSNYNRRAEIFCRRLLLRMLRLVTATER